MCNTNVQTNVVEIKVISMFKPNSFLELDVSSVLDYCLI